MTAKDEWVTDEGGHIFVTYRIVDGEIEITTDDRDDGFAAEPGIHTQRCTSIRLEGNGLSPEGCR